MLISILIALQFVFLTPCFHKEMPQGCFFFLPLVQLSVNHPTVSHLSNKSHAATKPLRSPCSAQRSFSENTLSATAGDVFFPLLFFSFLFFLHSANLSLVVHFIWKQGAFSDLTFHSYKCWFFLLYLVHVYIVSCIAQQRNNIKCIIFVVLHWLCVVYPSPTGTVRETESTFCSLLASSQMRCDSFVIEWDIYLYSPYCTSRTKWVYMCTNRTMQVVVRPERWLMRAVNEDKCAPAFFAEMTGLFTLLNAHICAWRDSSLLSKHSGKMQVQGRISVRQIIQICAWQNTIIGMRTGDFLLHKTTADWHSGVCV